MRKKPSDIVAIRGNGTAITLKEMMSIKPDYAVNVFESALSRRSIELEYEGKSTTGLYELWEWIYGESDRKRKRGPIPIRRRQAIKALILHEWLGIPWKELPSLLNLTEQDRKSLENTASQLRKLIDRHHIDLGIKPPRVLKQQKRK